MIKDIDVVLSSRIRFARNIKDYPFAARLDATSCREIIEKVEGVLDGFVKTDFTDMDSVEAQSYVEAHRVSSNFAVARLPHALLEKGDTRVMVCEEDHIRLQVIKQGFMLEDAYNEALLTDDRLTSALRIAYDEKLGYLTHCPTNLGNAMRASVMMFLPALAMSGELKGIVSQLSKLGITVRGLYGEGSSAHGYIYQISNARTMGVSETEAISRLSDVVTQIITHERNARERIKAAGDGSFDPICRAYGTLKYARIMTSSEFIELYARVRLGIAIGIIDEIGYASIDSLFTAVMPCTLIRGTRMTEAQRDRKRAEVVRNRLKEKEE